MSGWRAPTVEIPHWCDPQGRRSTVQAALAGADPSARAAVVRAHADAVGALIHAAGEARLGDGGSTRARALATQAARLCGELAGLWPMGSDEPLA
jgi:hypothetical protein